MKAFKLFIYPGLVIATVLFGGSFVARPAQAEHVFKSDCEAATDPVQRKTCLDHQAAAPNPCEPKTGQDRTVCYQSWFQQGGTTSPGSGGSSSPANPSASACTRQSVLPDLFEGLRRSDCSVNISSLADVYKILANGIEVGLVVVGLVAVGYIMFGAYLYMSSRGDPTKIARAKQTIVYAVTGLITALLAFAIVTVISGGFESSV